MTNLPQKHAYAIALATVAAIYLAVIWSLPALPGQDLPQHLAYGRILGGLGEPSLGFASTYVTAPAFQTYFTAHYVLAFLGWLTSVEVGIRVIYSAYALGMLAAFDHLVRSVHGARDNAPWPGLLGALFVWNPIAMMGFLSFMVAMPFLVFSVSAAVRWLRSAKKADLAKAIVAAAAVGMLHAFAAGCVLLVALLIAALAARGARRRLAVGSVGGAAVLSQLLAAAFGESGVGSLRAIAWADAFRSAQGLEGVGLALQASWSDTLTNASYLLWSATGPYRTGVCAAILLAAAGLGALVYFDPARFRPRTRSRIERRMLWVAAAVLAVGLLAPFGVAAPEEITFVNLRLIALGVLLLAAIAIRPRFFQSRRARAALAVFAIGFSAHFAVQARAFGGEAEQAFALVDQVDADATMATVTFHNHSDAFGKQFRLTHFLPMYFTVRQGGRSAQFWGRYTRHLPVDFQDAARPVQAPDWRPAEFDVQHLVDADYVLIQRADATEDPRDVRAASAAAIQRLAPMLEVVDQNGLWTLYRVPVQTRALAQRAHNTQTRARLSDS